MRTVILGGSGFIGSALAAYLAKLGESVVIPSRSPQAHAPRKPHIKYAQWDGKNADQLAEILTDASAVVNLLGENIAAGRWTPERKARLVSSRVRAGEALYAACKTMSAPPRTIIQGSAVGFYGAWPVKTTAPLCREDSPAGKNFLADVVLQWEAAGAAVAELPHVRRCVIRTSPVLGPGGGMLTPLLPLFRHGLGGRVGSGKQPFPWIHLDDEVAAIDFLLRRHDLSGVFNLAAPSLDDMSDFVAGLAQAVRRPAVLPVPGFVLRLALGEMADELLLNGQCVLPERLLRAGFNFKYGDLTTALQACVTGA